MFGCNRRFIHTHSAERYTARLVAIFEGGIHKPLPPQLPRSPSPQPLLQKQTFPLPIYDTRTYRLGEAIFQPMADVIVQSHPSSGYCSVRCRLDFAGFRHNEIAFYYYWFFNHQPSTLAGIKLKRTDPLTHPLTH